MHHCTIREEAISPEVCEGIILNATTETLATCQLCEHGPRPAETPRVENFAAPGEYHILVPIDEVLAAPEPAAVPASPASEEHTQAGDEFVGMPGLAPAREILITNFTAGELPTFPNPSAPARDARIEKIAAAKAAAAPAEPAQPAGAPAGPPVSAQESAQMVSYGHASPGHTPARLRLYAATGKTRKELAGEVGCSPENISAILATIERGGRPRGKAYARLLGKLGSRADWVFGSAAHDPEPVAAPAEPPAQAVPADLSGVTLETLLAELKGRLPGVAITLAM